MKHKQPVDIVYLWVDGNDPVWRNSRRQAAAALCTARRDAMARYGNVEGRFRDNDELRYSLRALERFFPDHGHVYIVTDAQVPAWLAPSDRLTVVDHRDLIPAHALPTFDSGHIESYIHHIPNLSERYFYLNDDVFFGAPVHIDDWFWEGGLYLAWSDEPAVTDEPLRQDATALENACRRSIQWFRASALGTGTSAPEITAIARRYRHTFRTFAHAPRPMCRSFMLGLEQLAPEMFASVRTSVFRTWDNPTIVSDFVMRWALASGSARIRDYAHVHVSTGDAGKEHQLQQLVGHVGALAFFCINDTTDDAQAHDPRLTRVRAVLQQMFPVASRFEGPPGKRSAQRHLREAQAVVPGRTNHPAQHPPEPCTAG